MVIAPAPAPAPDTVGDAAAEAFQAFTDAIQELQDTAADFMTGFETMTAENAEAAKVIGGGPQANLDARLRMLRAVLYGLRELHPDVVKILAWLPGSAADDAAGAAHFMGAVDAVEKEAERLAPKAA